MYFDFETWKYMFLRRSLASLACAYKLQLFLSVHLGGGAPPPHTKKLATYTAHPYKSDYLPPPLACQLVPPENEDPFLGEDFFFFLARGGGGGGACQLKNVVPLQNPRPPPPPVPPYWKNPSYATDVQRSLVPQLLFSLISSFKDVAATLNTADGFSGRCNHVA